MNVITVISLRINPYGKRVFHGIMVLAKGERHLPFIIIVKNNQEKG